jgi:hypothetical protein
MNIIDRLMQIEPARAFLLIRAVAYLAAGATGAWLSPDSIEPILGSLAILFGVDVTTTEATRRRVTSPETAGQLVASIFVGEVGRYIRVPKGKVTEGLRAALPVMTEFAASQLDEDARAKIQARVGTALYGAGLTKRRKWGPTSLLVALVMTVAVAPACAPLLESIGGEAVDRTNDVILGDPDASLRGADAGLVFDPGENPAQAVVVFIIGEDLVIEDDRCSSIEAENAEAADCRRGDVTGPATIAVWPAEGASAYADATYTRDGSSVPYRITIE